MNNLISNNNVANNRVIAYGMDYGQDLKTFNTIIPQQKLASRNQKLSNANSYNGNIDMR